MSNKQNKLIKELISKLEQDGVDVSKYTQELEDINKNLKGKKYGLVWEQHTEPLIEELKSKVVELQEVKERRIFKGEEYTNNFLIEGDNLESLNALLKSGLEGKIDVIEIDVPYNTLNAGSNALTYLDKRIDGEDTFRHSKWLSFMEIRLKKLRDLLTDDGIILIHIDDNELYTLKLLCDSIYGETNYLNTIVWVYENSTMKSSVKRLSTTHEYILMYAKDTSKFNINKVRYGDISENLIKRFGKYTDSDYNIRLKDVKNEKSYLSRMIPKFIKEYGREPSDEDIIAKLQPNYLRSVINIPTMRGNELKNKFGVEFSNPKNTKLIKLLLSLNTRKDAVVLDCFAGSGSTGHAVLELNKEDGGNRRFILCTNNENNICEDITYQRLNKVINGYTTPKGKEVKGIPANLTYLKTNLINKEDDYIMYDSNHLEYIINLLKLKHGITNELDLNSSEDVENKLIKISTESLDIYVYLNDYIDEEDFNNLELNKEKENIIYVDESLVNDKYLLLKGFKNINSVNNYFK